MTPRAYLSNELESVRGALKEILRHDYGIDSAQFHQEFAYRIDGLKAQLASAGDDPEAIQPIANEIRDVAARISLIERSHLGEFSWPFARTLQEIGASFVEGDMEGEFKPLVHVIAEGALYKIIHDNIATIRRRPIPVVAFPRQLKHHVLLHALFGHEMGHLAMRVTGTRSRINTEVLPHLQRGALQNEQVVDGWLKGSEVSGIRRQFEGVSFNFSATMLGGWLTEFTSDMFGLILFGPAFVAAHRTLLEPQHAAPYRLNISAPTHPPYAVRRSLLSRALVLLGWSQPRLPDKTPERKAENAFLAFLCKDRFAEEAWTRDLIADEDLKQALDGLRAICPDHAFEPLAGPDIGRLLLRFTRSLPPLIEKIAATRKGERMEIALLTEAQVLHAGWMYWIGRDHLANERDLTFEEVNRLCEMALIQHRAIALTQSLRK